MIRYNVVGRSGLSELSSSHRSRTRSAGEVTIVVNGETMNLPKASFFNRLRIGQEQEWNSLYVMIRFTVLVCDHDVEIPHVHQGGKVPVPLNKDGMQQSRCCHIADGLRCRVQTCECAIESGAKELVSYHPEHFYWKVRQSGRIG